jgi:hypothetical protein
MRYIVDRIETDKAVLEGKVNKRQRIVPLEQLPEGIKDGDILSYKRKTYTLLTEETLKETEFMKNRFNKLKHKKKSN